MGLLAGDLEGEAGEAGNCMRKIFLTSNGFSPELKAEFLKLLDGKPADMKLAFVGTAADPEPDKGYVLKDRADLETFGFKEIVEVDLKNKEDVAKLDECQVIFVEGGNTYYLLKWVRESGFDKKLKEHFANDRAYIGASAGSMVLGTSIETAAIPPADKNDVELEDLRGLRQVPFMMIPHLEPRSTIEIDLFARKAALRPIIGITDGQAIVCEGDRYRLIGPGKPATWNSKLFR